MSYNGRAIMAQVAEKAGWTVISNVPGDVETPGMEVDFYMSCAETIGKLVAIGWTPENTAPVVVVDGQPVRGATALIEARRYIEANAKESVS